MNRGKITPILVAALLVAGIALIGLGWGWSSVVPSTAYWGPEQAEELIEAQADLHAKTHNDGNRKNNEQEFAAARDRLSATQRHLEFARDLHHRTGKYLAALGVLMSLAGIALHLAAKRSM